jgi:hypothetical protein
VFSVLASLADSPSSSSASLAGELVQAISAPASTVTLVATTNALSAISQFDSVVAFAAHRLSCSFTTSATENAAHQEVCVGVSGSWFQ